jgi:protein ImuA
MAVSIPDLHRTLAPADRRWQLFGVDPIDHALGGGLALGAIHELCPSRPLDHGAATGFAAALAGRALGGRQVLWIQQDFAGIEAGKLYGAIDVFGIPLASLLLVQVSRGIDVLWSMEEALKCRALAAVVAEIADDKTVDLTATRRLALAARAGDGLGLVLRQRPPSVPSAAVTRWNIASARSARDRFGGLVGGLVGGLGPTTFDLSLVRNRCGPCGRWTLSWDHHARTFIAPALSRGVAQTARDRSARALSVRAA